MVKELLKPLRNKMLILLYFICAYFFYKYCYMTVNGQNKDYRIYRDLLFIPMCVIPILIESMIFNANLKVMKDNTRKAFNKE